MTVLMAQLSDLHLRGREDPRPPAPIDAREALEAALRRIGSLPVPPTALLITGDIADRGSPDAYRFLRERLQGWPGSVHLLPGNHDDRGAMVEVFPALGRTDPGGFLLDSVRLAEPVPADPLRPGARLILLDTVAPGHDAGFLCPLRLQWLAQALDAARDEEVVIAMHHPPFATHLAAMDAIGLLGGAAEFIALVSRHPRVAGILCGHVHRAIFRGLAGTQAIVAPSTVHQMDLDLRPRAEHAWTREPAGLLLHAWTPGQGLVTHVATTVERDGPYPFDA